MATSKDYFGRPSHHYLPLSGDTHSLSLPMDSDSDSGFEFDESDIYSSGHPNSLDLRKSLNHASRFTKNKKPSSPKLPDSGGRVGAPGSMPVNVPDWSKILGKEYRENRRRSSIDRDGGSCDGEMGGGELPHEFVARTRMASLSVQEGVGRTLKGRDLSRVRNAIWAITGFQD